jgi:hypothetical protein
MQRYTCALTYLSLVGLVSAAVACSTGDAASGPGGTTPGSDSGTNNNNNGSDSSTPNNGEDSSTGGSDTGGGGGSSVCDGAGTRALTIDDAFIDDFEEATISPGWSSFNDVKPTPNAIKILQVAGGAATTAHSGKYSGTGATIATAGGFGVGTVYNVAIAPAGGIYCIDVSAFDGVAFWAKAGTAGAKISLNFVIPQTNQAGTDDQGRPNGGDCKAHCFNHPKASVTLTTDWAQYTVKFADASGGSAKVTNLIQELAWLSPDSDWDFSLDEISFYKGTPPTGPVHAGGAKDAGSD